MRHTIQVAMAVMGSVLTILFSSTPLFAESKSQAVRVSCTIVPILEIASPKRVQESFKTVERPNLEMISNEKAAVQVRTNLQKNFHLTESLEKTPRGSIKIYSLTAL